MLALGTQKIKRIYSKERGEAVAKVLLEGQVGDEGGQTHRDNGMPMAERAEQVAMGCQGRKEDLQKAQSPLACIVVQIVH